MSLGWKERIKAVFIDKAEDWKFGELLPNQIPNGKPGVALERDKVYVTVKLRSMRVVNFRRGLKKFYGAVHSYITLGHTGNQKAEIEVVTTPAELKGIDATNLNRVLTFDKDLLTFVPYRGDGLDIELGLYSITAENLTDSFLKVLEGLSEAGGVSFVSSAIPFVKPLSDGVDLLLGTTQEQILEIGLSTKVSNPKTGTFVIMRAPASSINLSDYKLDDAYRLVDKNGNTMGDFPYMVYSIESSNQRENWYQIPEISQAFKTVNDAIREGNIKKIDDAFKKYSLIVASSQDLIDDDQQKMIDVLESKIEKLKKTVLKREREGEKKTADIGSLEDLNIYG